jgi:hypothetical protein
MGGFVVYCARCTLRLANLAWRTEAGKPRVSVGYVGDDLKPNTWYRVNERGEFIEV